MYQFSSLVPILFPCINPVLSGLQVVDVQPWSLNHYHYIITLTAFVVPFATFNLVSFFFHSHHFYLSLLVDYFFSSLSVFSLFSLCIFSLLLPVYFSLTFNYSHSIFPPFSVHFIFIVFHLPVFFCYLYFFVTCIFCYLHFFVTCSILIVFQTFFPSSSIPHKF